MIAAVLETHGGVGLGRGGNLHTLDGGVSDLAHCDGG